MEGLPSPFPSHLAEQTGTARITPGQRALSTCLPSGHFVRQARGYILARGLARVGRGARLTGGCPLIGAAVSVTPGFVVGAGGGISGEEWRWTGSI